MEKTEPIYDNTLGLFRGLPLEIMDISWICKLTEAKPHEVAPVLERLLESNDILEVDGGFQLTGKWLENFIKNVQ